MLRRKPSSVLIEGTQASLEGILEFEADLTPRDDIASVREVINYIKALDYGIRDLKISRCRSAWSVKSTTS